ncbi:pathogenesis-related protein PRB1-3-like [Wolffia australiana]
MRCGRSIAAVVHGLMMALLCGGQNYPIDYLISHNAARAEVGVGPLFWNPGLEAYAFGYSLIRSIDCALIHSRGPYGENIYIGHGQGASAGIDAVRWWYNEKPLYDYATNECIGDTDCLHYTQMVWRGSVFMGCARVRCRDGINYFVSCNYYPRGNIEGERPF